MKVHIINNHRVEVYDSIDEMPIQRFHKYNKYLLIESGVGGDIQDIMDHIQRAQIYVTKEPKLAIIELQNLAQSVAFISNEMSPKYMAFAALVKSIDGKPQEDLSDLGIQKVMDILNKEKKGWLDGVLNSVKKKIDRELKLYFPGKFNETSTQRYMEELKRHTQVKLDAIITGEDKGKEISDLEANMAMLARPRLFTGNRSVEITYDKQFEDMCLILTHHLQVDTKMMTVLQFFNAFDYLKKMMKRNKAK